MIRSDVPKAIETIYNGYRFRSRLEARWAVFFDTLGVRYEYEQQGYDLGPVGWYLPDFWLPTWKAFVEIKPSLEEKVVRDEAMVKLRTLIDAKVSEAKIALLVGGNPWPGAYSVGVYPFAYTSPPEAAIGVWEDSAAFGECRRCDTIWLLSTCEWWPWAQLLERWETTSCAVCAGLTDRWPLLDSERMLAAYTRARQARFEHGERP